MKKYLIRENEMSVNKCSFSKFLCKDMGFYVNSNRVISNMEAHFKVQIQEWNRYSSVGCLRVYV